MEENPVRDAVERVRAIADDERRMVAAQELIRDFHSGESDLVDIRSEAARRLRAGDKRRWTYARIAAVCGVVGDHLTQKGRAIVEGSRRKSRSA